MQTVLIAATCLLGTVLPLHLGLRAFGRSIERSVREGFSLDADDLP